MKGSLTASTFARLSSLIPFRLFTTQKFSLLILCSGVPLFIFSSSFVSVAKASEIVQVVNGGSINRPTLRAGSQGDSVLELQGALKLLGYYTGEVDGNYNEQTIAAVSQFQKSAGLPADGIVAASTWQKLFPGGTTASASLENTSNSAITRNETEAFPVPTERANSNRITNSRSQTKPVTRTTTTASSPEPKPTARATTPASNPEPKPTARATTPASNPEPKPTARATTPASNPEPQAIRRVTSTTSNSGTKPAARNRNTSSQPQSPRTSQGTRSTQTSQANNRTSSATRSSQTTRSNQTARSTQTTRASQGTGTQQTTPSSRTTQSPGIQYTSAGMPILRLGMQGEEVLQLQRRLRRLGFFEGAVDGDFGAETETAVKAFQQKYGIEADGVVGGGTWVYLMPRRQQQRQ
jgi:peptidoglycan hydrolase-like protein with peptidoglycan-binding domain